jgi:hypothetical protein
MFSYSLLGSAAGVGVMLGPVVGAAFASEATPSTAYLTGAAVSAVQLAWSSTMIHETLELNSIHLRGKSGSERNGETRSRSENGDDKNNNNCDNNNSAVRY